MRSDSGRRDMPFLTVQAPVAYEGLGLALRSAFCADPNGLPADMSALLDRLDDRNR